MVNPLMLASTIGLTEGDRRFLAAALDAAARRTGGKPATLARQVFEGQQFADVLAAGPLPDREEFKDRFVAGIDEVLVAGRVAGLAIDRQLHASGPRAESEGHSPEPEVVPTTACLRCHEVRGSMKAPVFDPIPPLAFDPFDKVGRETWAAVTADRKLKRHVLERMAKRLYEDRDMPPEDAPEHTQFRVGGTAAFADAKMFLDTELKKVKGR